MATALSYNVAGVREDLTDFLTILEPEDTPKLSMFSKTPRPTQFYQEWQADNLLPPLFAGVLEGQDAASFKNAAVNRGRFGNYVQKFQREWAVSDILEASDVAGVSDEKANAKTKKMREIKRDIEAALGSDNEMQADNGTVPYLMRGLGKWVQSTAQSTNPVPTLYLTPSASIDTTTSTLVTESIFNGVFSSIYEQNGGKRNYMLFAGPLFKKAVSLFQRVQSTTYAQSYIVTQAADQHQIDLHVDIYNGDFHNVTVVPDLFNGVSATVQTASTWVTAQTRMRAYVIDPELVGVSYMIGLTNMDLPDQGAGPRGLIKSVPTLMVKNPKGLGKFAGAS